MWSGVHKLRRLGGCLRIPSDKPNQGGAGLGTIVLCEIPYHDGVSPMMKGREEGVSVADSIALLR